ncbi:unnamed protein product [Ceutorhynchus assimilis]|uniref:Peptidase S1 domain-containing protein n=1 Tax=Ceutorhynchus assimilis TaxID=467358 RepID=A0A9N9MQE4_9CUCU|nr:unnamed protein product [Ceutorhynchus assimilis]
MQIYVAQRQLNLFLDSKTTIINSPTVLRKYRNEFKVFYNIGVLFIFRLADRHICGAALIAARYGLSAAHCFKEIALYSVRAGSDFKDSGGNITNISNIYVHPERSIYNYDIAILVFQNPLNLSSTIQPVKLPTNNDILAPGIRGTVSGFGDIYYGQTKGSKLLKAAQMSVIDSEWCKNQYKEYEMPFTEIQFCAGGDNMANITDSCHGDSGGPFVTGNILHGIVAYGLECGDPKHPGVYTNVAALRDFIWLNTGI